jgi:octaprenyl-diphosphate synthase
MCVLLAARAVGSSSAQTRDLAMVAELVHLATLLHDDVVDDGSERRGVPTARRLWGNAVSVLAGDHLLVQALERAALAAPGPTFQELLGTLRALVSGEIVQLRGRTSLDATRDVYDVIVRDKTASLFRWAFRAGARSGGAADAHIEALGSFGAALGLAFQIVDDVLDYQGDPAATGKTLLADLQEGKVTLPLLFAAEDDQEILPLLGRARSGDEASANEIASRILAGSACERSRAEARAHVEQGKQALHGLGATEARELLVAVAEQVVLRAA